MLIFTKVLVYCVSDMLFCLYCTSFGKISERKLVIYNFC